MSIDQVLESDNVYRDASNALVLVWSIWPYKHETADKLQQKMFRWFLII